MKPIKILSCYSGCGGDLFALKKAEIPFEVVGISEIKQSAIKIHELNHGKHTNYGDITKINPKDLPDFDLITGGFPCQDVSLAGLRDLSQGRTNTVFKMLEIIKEKKPKYCLLENVQGILSILNGNLIREIVRQLKSFGYAVSYELLYSKDYGTPQTRPRVWIACELNRTSFMFNPFPPKEELKLTVQNLLEKQVDESFYLTHRQIKRVIERSKIRNKPLGVRINPIITSTLTSKDPKSNPTDCIYISSNIVNTITSGDYAKQVYNNQYIIEENTKIRILTPRETFRLMGFFEFKGDNLIDTIDLGDLPKTNLYDLAGNGWEQNVASKIFNYWFNNK